jgi:hypothetical protein
MKIFGKKGRNINAVSKQSSVWHKQAAKIKIFCQLSIQGPTIKDKRQQNL